MGAQAVKPIGSSEPDDLRSTETECLKFDKEQERIDVIKNHKQTILFEV
jgi:hypothetical protein